MVKRDPDSASASASDSEHKPSAKKRATPKSKGTDTKKTSTWTTDKRAALLEFVIAEGAKSANLDKIASDLGVTKSQVVDQLKPNRSNLRRQAVEAIKSSSGKA